MANVLIFVFVILVAVGMTNTPFGLGISNFLLAGIIPGTDYQLPWYVSLMITPAVLLMLGLLLYNNISTFKRAHRSIAHQS